MSDGRPVPVEALDSLDMYPGERFTVLIQPGEGYDGGFHAEFLHMLDDQSESMQWISVRDDSLHPSSTATLEEESATWFPNPASDFVQINLDRSCTVWDPWGRITFQGKLEGNRLDVSAWPNGVYITRTERGRVSRFVVSH